MQKPKKKSMVFVVNSMGISKAAPILLADDRASDTWAQRQGARCSVTKFDCHF